MAEKFAVSGLKELEKKLLELGGDVGVKTLRAAGREAMKPVLASAQSKVNVDKGDLKSALAISVAKGKGKTAVNINVGATRKRSLKSQGGKILSRTNAKAIAQEFGTKRQKAEPFLRPALTTNASRVLQIFKKSLGEKIEKAAKK